MLSRVAESIYWMNRYIERAENYSRMLGENLNLALELPPGIDEQWNPLVFTAGDQEDFKNRYSDRWTRENVIQFLTFDQENPNSIVSALTRARENARSVREIISSEMWNHINEMYISAHEAANSPHTRSPETFYREIKTGSHLLAGLSDATMSHGEGWEFGRLGRYLERADMTSRIIDIKYYYLLPSTSHIGLAIDLIHWVSVLRSATAYEMYRKTFGKPESKRIVEFLTLDYYFPRSIHFCLSRAQDSIHAISGSPQDRFVNRAEKLIGRLKSNLDYTDGKDIVDAGIHEFMDNLQNSINEISISLYDVFFLPTEDTGVEDHSGNTTIPGKQSQFSSFEN